MKYLSLLLLHLRICFQSHLTRKEIAKALRDGAATFIVLPRGAHSQHRYPYQLSGKVFLTWSGEPMMETNNGIELVRFSLFEGEVVLRSPDALYWYDPMAPEDCQMWMA